MKVFGIKIETMKWYHRLFLFFIPSFLKESNFVFKRFRRKIYILRESLGRRINNDNKK